LGKWEETDRAWFYELFGIRPLRVKENWDDNDIWTQALILAYNQVYSYYKEPQVTSAVNSTKPSQDLLVC
jgi:hypothetical protein